MNKRKSISISDLRTASAWKSLTYDISLTILLVSIFSLIGNTFHINYLMTWANPWSMSTPTSCLFILLVIATYSPKAYHKPIAAIIITSAIYFRYIDYPGYAISTTTMQCFFALALFFSHPKATLACMIIPLWICFVGFSISFLKIQIPIMEFFIRQMSVPTIVSSIMTSLLLINLPPPQRLNYKKIHIKTLRNSIIILSFWIFLAILIHYSSTSTTQSVFAALLAISVTCIHVLLQSRSQLKGFSHHMEIALDKVASLIIVNTNAKILYANKHFLKKSEMQESTIKEKFYHDRFLKRSHKNTFRETLLELHGDQTWRGEFCSLNTNREPYWEETIITPISSELDNTKNFLIIAYDITERVQQTQELEEHRKELFQLLENNASLIHMRSRLMQVSTHKMKAPLYQVLSEIDTMLIQASPRDDAYLKLGNIHSKVEKVIRELTDLLNFEAETHKERYFNLSTFDADDLIYSEIEIFKTEIENKQLDFDYSCDLGEIHHAKPAIEHIVHILLKNAYERSSKLGKIRIHLKKDEENLYISVEDQGDIISENLQDKLLNTFQTHNLISQEEKTKVGMGLSFVKELTHGLQGKVELINLAPQGVCIKVTLPIKRNIKKTESLDIQEPENIKKPF